MKKSISCWSFPAGTRLEECFRACAEAGFEGLELALPCGRDEITPGSDREDLARVRQSARKHGIELSGLATGLFWEYSLTSASEPVRARALETAHTMLDFASHLGIDTILVIPGAVDVFFKPGGEIVPYDLAWDRALEAIRKLVPKAEKTRVNIGLENVWNKFLLSPLEMRDFIDRAGSERVGSYFDVGNTMLTGYPEHWIRILGRRIRKVHVKDFRTAAGTAAGFVDLLEGDVNWPEVLAALGEVGYDGFLTAEMLPPYRTNPLALVYQTSRAMDFMLGRA